MLQIPRAKGAKARAKGRPEGFLRKAGLAIASLALGLGCLIKDPVPSLPTTSVPTLHDMVSRHVEGFINTFAVEELVAWSAFAEATEEVIPTGHVVLDTATLSGCGSKKAINKILPSFNLSASFVIYLLGVASAKSIRRFPP